MLLSASDTIKEHCRSINSACLHIPPPRQIWFQYVRREYATANKFSLPYYLGTIVLLDCLRFDQCKNGRIIPIGEFTKYIPTLKNINKQGWPETMRQFRDDCT